MNWHDEAACRNTDPELFFGAADAEPNDEQIAAAKDVCAQCPVRVACLADALARDTQFGIWGGRTYAEREDLRRRLGRARRATA